jgi:serine protease Do
MDASEFHARSSRYRGGLLVIDVRPGSPAAEHGVQGGDVLVGMHIWETTSLDNVTYILKRADLPSLTPLKVYILRDGETLYAHLPVGIQTARRP